MQGHIARRESRDRSGKKRTRWYVVVDAGRRADGKRRQKWHGSFKTRKEAEAARAKIVSDLNAGTYTEPTRITLGEYLTDTWLPSMQARVKPTTWDSYRRNLELHVLPRLSARPLQRLTATELNALYGDLLAGGNKKTEGGLSPKTVRYVHTTLHKALADAVDAGLLPRNPASAAKPPRPRAGAQAEMHTWTAEQLSTFLDSTRRDRLYSAFHLAAMTGMRRGEVLGLRWHDIDLEQQQLAVRHTLVIAQNEVRSSTPKSHQARVIDLDQDTCEILRRQHTAQESERIAWGDGYEESDLVFTREDGSAVNPGSFTGAFERLVANSDCPRIRLHDLRHTHATLGLSAGVPVKVMSERLGHESAGFTLRQYAHVLPGMGADAASKIAALVAEA
ncbi:MAG: site-specific integrase [Hyphomicrobiales bacterium]|nr:site-specific integrase [Hyphomicrobiales bacterium]